MRFHDRAQADWIEEKRRWEAEKRQAARENELPFETRGSILRDFPLTAAAFYAAVAGVLLFKWSKSAPPPAKKAD